MILVRFTFAHSILQFCFLSLLLLLLDLSQATPQADEESCSTVNNIPTTTLHNGLEMPLLSLGTAHAGVNLLPDGNKNVAFNGLIPERTYRQVELALQTGIRSFDTALIYRSQEPLGTVLGNWFTNGKLTDRTDLFITSKVYHMPFAHFALERDHTALMDTMTPEEVDRTVRVHVETCMAELRLAYIDLMLLHWPSGPNAQDETIARQRRFAAWKVLEEYYNKGWLRSIGVSNFSVKHLQQLQEDGASIVPMVNQIEGSPYLQFKDIVQYCQEHNIVIQAFSPLGNGRKDITKDEVLIKIASSKNKTIGQIALRYLIQLGYAITYLTTKEERMVSNSDIFDFELSQEEMIQIDGLNRPDGSFGLPSPYDLL